MRLNRLGFGDGARNALPVEKNSDCHPADNATAKMRFYPA
jgi:hypothetical protein